MKDQAKQNFTDTDYAFKLYSQTHQNEKITVPKEPKFSDFYQPSKQQKDGELMFIGVSTLALDFCINLIYTCMYVCMYVCIRVCVCVHLPTPTCGDLSMFTHQHCGDLRHCGDLFGVPTNKLSPNVKICRETSFPRKNLEVPTTHPRV